MWLCTPGLCEPGCVTARKHSGQVHLGRAAGAADGQQICDSLGQMKAQSYESSLSAGPEEESCSALETVRSLLKAAVTLMAISSPAWHDADWRAPTPRESSGGELIRGQFFNYGTLTKPLLSPPPTIPPRIHSICLFSFYFLIIG